MRRLALILAIFLIGVSAWCMPPMPGSGHTHDGSLKGNVYPEPYVDSDGVMRVPPRYNSTTATTGSKKLLVILVDFPAQGGVPALTFNDPEYYRSGSEVHNVAYYKNLLETDSTNLTMKQYYKDMSNNQLDLSFEIIGPFTAAHNYKYYGGNDAAGDDLRVPHLIYEILSRSDVKSLVPAAADNCGVIFIHAGPGEENGTKFKDLIWSCRSSLSRQQAAGEPVAPVPINGKYYDNYTIQSEFVIGNNSYEAGIGIFCHEFGHLLGLLDLYDTGAFSQKTAGVGNWSLMSSGSWGSDDTCADPAPLMNWERATLGWLPEQEINPGSTPQKVTFTNADSADKVLRINLAEDQYLVFDGKKKNADGTGKFVLEDGLLITQVHDGVYKNYMKQNNFNSTNYRVHAISIVEAKSDYYASKGLGNLWMGDGESERNTSTACFRSDTATYVGPMVNGKPVSAEHPLFIVLFKTMITSFAIVGLVYAVYCGRKKLCLVLAGAVAMVFFCLACDAGGGGGDPDPGPSTYDSGPNTNYYDNMGNVHSKTGVTNIRIYDIQWNSDGSGSFWVKKGK